VVFCGEKPLAEQCLAALLEMPAVSIPAVCTRGEGDTWWGRQGVRELARQAGLPVVRRRELLEIDFDILLSVLYPFVIEAPIIGCARRMAVNLHEAPLPRWRGCNAPSHAILAGDTTYGTTLHVLAAQLDAGDILAEDRFGLTGSETARELYRRTGERSLALFRRAFPGLLAGELPPRPQEEDESFCNGRDSLISLKQIDPHTTPEQLDRRVRALDFLPWEPAYIEDERGGRIYLYVEDGAGRSEHRLNVRRTVSAEGLAGLDASDLPVRVEGLSRPIVACGEDRYRTMFPLRGVVQTS
jgi:methionyl-tRNA formyltransferase